MVRTCCKCREEFPKELFVQKKNGELTLRCIACLKEDGVIICSHTLLKVNCKHCSVSCMHKKEITSCRMCSDPVPILVHKMVCNSLERDKRKDQFDADNCVDYEHVLGLIQEAEKKCHYCQCQLQYITYKDDLASLERLTNSLGHLKGNCVISCLKCNRLGVGEKIVRGVRAKYVPGSRTFLVLIGKLKI